MMKREKVCMIMETFVFIQLARDLMVELGNIPTVRDRFRYEVVNVNDRLERMRRRLRRLVSKDSFERFETQVCDIVDACEMHVNKIRLDLKTEMVNKVRYDQIETAILIGMTGGMIDVTSQYTRMATGKRNSDCEECLRYLRYIDTHIGFERMNEGIDVDPEKCSGAMEGLCKSISTAISILMVA